MRHQMIFQLWIVVAVLSVGPEALADDGGDAAQLYKDAVSAFQDGRYDEAADGFRAAHRARPAWKLLYNIGQSEAAARRHGLALTAFEAYLSQGGDEIPTDRREEVMGEVERLRKMVGRVEVTAPEGAVVFLDGVERGVAPILGRIPVAASVEHRVWAELDGERLPERAFQVSGGDAVKVELTAGEAEAEVEVEPQPAPVTEEPVTEEPAPEETSAAKKVAGWVSLGVGAALLVGGGITGGLALGTRGDFEGDCVDGRCPPEAEDDIEKMETLATTTNVLLGVGAAAAVTGVVLLIVSRPDEGEEGDVSFAPILGPGQAGLSFEGRF